MTAPWPASYKSSFDLVHSRTALPGVGTTPLSTAISNLIALVKPGGWIQFVEMEWLDWAVGPEMKTLQKATRQLFDLVTNGQGVDLRPKILEVMQREGLRNVGCEVVGVPAGKNAKEEARAWSEESMCATVKGVVETLGKFGVGGEELVGLEARVREEIRERGGEYKLFVLWGQMPEGSV